MTPKQRYKCIPFHTYFDKCACTTFRKITPVKTVSVTWTFWKFFFGLNSNWDICHLLYQWLGHEIKATRKSLLFHFFLTQTKFFTTKSKLIIHHQSLPSTKRSIQHIANRLVSKSPNWSGTPVSSESVELLRQGPKLWIFVGPQTRQFIKDKIHEGQLNDR